MGMVAGNGGHPQDAVGLIDTRIYGNPEEIREAAKIFQKAYAPQEKRDLPVTFADLRKKENKASEAH